MTSAAPAGGWDVTFLLWALGLLGFTSNPFSVKRRKAGGASNTPKLRLFQKPNPGTRN